MLVAGPDDQCPCQLRTAEDRQLGIDAGFSDRIPLDAVPLLVYVQKVIRYGYRYIYKVKTKRYRGPLKVVNHEATPEKSTIAIVVGLFLFCACCTLLIFERISLELALCSTQEIVVAHKEKFVLHFPTCVWIRVVRISE